MSTASSRNSIPTSSTASRLEQPEPSADLVNGGNSSIAAEAFENVLGEGLGLSVARPTGPTFGSPHVRSSWWFGRRNIDPPACTNVLFHGSAQKVDGLVHGRWSTHTFWARTAALFAPV